MEIWSCCGRWPRTHFTPTSYILCMTNGELWLKANTLISANVYSMFEHLRLRIRVAVYVDTERRGMPRLYSTAEITDFIVFNVCL